MVTSIGHHDIDKAPDGTGFNDPPVGLREVTEKDFAQSMFFTYSPMGIESRQIFTDKFYEDERGRKVILSLTIFWMHDETGVCMSNNYWDGKIRYFLCGCDHDYQELSWQECKERGIRHEGRCWHVTECKTCKNISAHDSSD